MTKQAFLEALNQALRELPENERSTTLSYYSELIDDRIEEGQSEQQAVEGLGPVAAIAGEILGEVSFPKLLSADQPTGRKVLTTVLLILGFPLWGTLLLVALVLLLVTYILLYIPIVILGTLTISFFASSIFGLVGTPFLFMDAGLLPALFQLGGCIAVLGLSLLSAVGLYCCTGGIVKAGKALWRFCKSLFIKRKGAAA